MSQWNTLVSAQVLSFLCGCVVAMTAAGNRWWMTAGTLLLCTLGATTVGSFAAYPVMASVVVIVCVRVRRPGYHELRAISDATYEFYLVHGPIYLGLARYAGFSLATNACIGTLLAVVATVILKGLSAAFVARVALSRTVTFCAS